jgi:hypothetical protein
MIDKHKKDFATEPKKRSPKLPWGPRPGRQQRPGSRASDRTILEQKLRAQRTYWVERFRRREILLQKRLRRRAEFDERQIWAVRDAAFFIVQTRGRISSYRRRYLTVGGHGFTISLYTPFNPSLVQPNSQQFSRRFAYRILIWRHGRRCLDAFWNTDRDLYVESIHPRRGWRKQFLEGARRVKAWRADLDYR